MARRTYLLSLLALLMLLIVAGGGAAQAPVPLTVNTDLPDAGVPSSPMLPAQAVAASAPVGSRLFLRPSTPGNTYGASVAVDAGGGIHAGLIAESTADGQLAAYYAYCPTGCADPSHWTLTKVGDPGAFGGYVRLALDPAGHPRMLWYRLTDGLEGGAYQYAQCNGSCTSAASWAAGSVAGASPFPDDNRYFALDPQGRPRFLYTDTRPDHTGTFYAYCDANCTLAANWHEGRIEADYLLYNFSLAFDPTGRPRFAYASGDAIGYGKCDASCSTTANWSLTLLTSYAMGTDSAFSMQLDTSGRPRLALYQGYLGEGRRNNLLYYAWCNADCNTLTNWHAWSLRLSEGYGRDVDLVLDKQNRPRVAYNIDHTTPAPAVDGLGYSECLANCQSTAPIWQSRVIERVEDLNASDPWPPAPPCTTAGWQQVGRQPALALDPAGNPRLAYEVQHYQAGGSCTLYVDAQLVRLALFEAGGPARSTNLPLAQR